MRRIVLIAITLSVGASVRIAAETHRFVPQQFYNTYSFAHPPALHVKPGDRVITKTIDAGGVDWNGKSVGTGPNPQTGPFYIDGAEPGDMIVVTIEKLETNRAMAYSSSLLAPYTVDPGAIASRVDREAKRATWTIDKARGVARLDQADIQPGGCLQPADPVPRGSTGALDRDGGPALRLHHVAGHRPRHDPGHEHRRSYRLRRRLRLGSLGPAGSAVDLHRDQ